jgi:hypothetical protein
MGNPQDYGVIHYLDDSLLDDYSFYVKKLHRKLFPTSFLEWLILGGTKIIYVLLRKPQIKFGTRCPESVLSFQHSLNQKESSWDSNKCSKQQKTKCVNKNSSSLANFSVPLKRVNNFCYIFINADLLPPVVAMHACIGLRLCEHDIPTACNVDSRRCWW